MHQFLSLFRGYKVITESPILGEGVYGHRNGYAAALFESKDAAIDAGEGLDQKVLDQDPD